MNIEKAYIKVREMSYGRNSGKRSVLCLGRIGYRWFAIVDCNGMFPIAYVEAKPGDPYLGDDYAEDESLTAGLYKRDYEIPEDAPESYVSIDFGPESLELDDEEETVLFSKLLSKKYWAWDYGHAGDYAVIRGEVCDGKEHTVKEIFKEDIIPFVKWVNAVNSANRQK